MIFKKLMLIPELLRPPRAEYFGDIDQIFDYTFQCNNELERLYNSWIDVDYLPSFHGRMVDHLHTIDPLLASSLDAFCKWYQNPDQPIQVIHDDRTFHDILGCVLLDYDDFKRGKLRYQWLRSAMPGLAATLEAIRVKHELLMSRQNHAV